MSNEKQRSSKEAVYEAANQDITSVCSGQFYIKNRNTYEQCKNCENCFKYKHYTHKKENTPEVHYHYVSTFRNCEFYKVRPKDGNYIITTSIYNIIYVNDLACATIIDLCDKIKHQDKETQKIFGALRKRQKTYEKTINTILAKEIDFLAEYNSYMDDFVQEKIESFVSAMNDMFAKEGYENSEFLALTEVMRTMVGYSVLNTENRVRECLKYKKESVHLRQYKLNEILRVAENFSNWVTRKCNKLDINKNERVMNAYRALDKTLTNSDIINEALFKAKDIYVGR